LTWYKICVFYTSTRLVTSTTAALTAASRYQNSLDPPFVHTARASKRACAKRKDVQLGRGDKDQVLYGWVISIALTLWKRNLAFF
jgi:hypothetical protein